LITDFKVLEKIGAAAQLVCLITDIKGLERTGAAAQLFLIAECTDYTVLNCCPAFMLALCFLF
jgi:hypothetical protein